MLEARVRKRIGGLDLDVRLSVGADAVLVAGPNGSGKSTLLRLLLGVLRPDSGSIALDGRTLFDGRIDLPPEERRLGYLPQDYALFPHLDVSGNVAFGLPRSDRRRRAVEWLERLDAGHLAARRIGALSGGERQRVALGRALMSGPSLLLLDEPLAAVDVPLRRRILPYLKRVRDELTVPIIYVSHDRDEVDELADVVVKIDAGRVIGVDRVASSG
jgi:molybdate transport system ATP-binding protein